MSRLSLFILFFLIIDSVFISCSPKREALSTRYGYAASNTRFWDSSAKKFVTPPNITDCYFWYRDSLVIYENYVLDTDTGPDGKTKYAFSVMYYTFLDLRTKHGYDYMNFSDTAKCSKARVILPDLRYGKIWAFYGEMPIKAPDSTIKQMPDTIMNNRTYRRYSMYNTFNNNDGSEYVYEFIYINCNAANKMFQYDKLFSAKYANGCPIQRYDTYWPKNNMLMSGEFEFHRNTLTAKEMKVFDTWERYGREHPVKE